MVLHGVQWFEQQLLNHRYITNNYNIGLFIIWIKYVCFLNF